MAQTKVEWATVEDCKFVQSGVERTTTEQEINMLDDVCSTVTIAYAAGTTTDCLVATFTVKDAAGATIDAMHHLEIWISDDADGNGLTATAASGALTAGASGTILTALTAKKHVTMTTAATGIGILELVDSANTAGERFVVKHPLSGKPIVGAATVAGDYEGG